MAFRLWLVNCKLQRKLWSLGEFADQIEAVDYAAEVMKATQGKDGVGIDDKDIQFGLYREESETGALEIKGLVCKLPNEPTLGVIIEGIVENE